MKYLSIIVMMILVITIYSCQNSSQNKNLPKKWDLYIGGGFLEVDGNIHEISLHFVNDSLYVDPIQNYSSHKANFKPVAVSKTQRKAFFDLATMVYSKMDIDSLRSSCSCTTASKIRYSGKLWIDDKPYKPILFPSQGDCSTKGDCNQWNNICLALDEIFIAHQSVYPIDKKE
jgi:hypothetical protein